MMRQQLNRRDFIKVGTGGLAAVCVGSIAGLPWFFRKEAFASTPMFPVPFGTPIQLKMEEAMFEMVDGIKVYSWAFRHAHPDIPIAQQLRIPGPIIWAEEGEIINLRITNAFPGGHTAAHAFAVPGIVDSGPIGPGQTAELRFAAPKAGTYIYHDPTNLPVNHSLGLHGVLITMPRRGNTPYSSPAPMIQKLFDHLGTKNWAPGKGSDQFPGHPWDPARQWIWANGCVDPAMNANVQSNNTLAGADFKAGFTAQYFMMNGRSGYFNAHGEDLKPFGNVGQPALLRSVGFGLQSHSNHIHGNHVYVLAENNSFGRTDVAEVPLTEEDRLTQNFAVRKNVAWVDTWRTAFGDRKDLLLPFIAPPDIPFERNIDFANAALKLPDRQARLHAGIDPNRAGKAWPPLEEPFPLEYPLHCHQEMSQTAAGGNYPDGVVCHWQIDGDVDMRPTLDVRGINRRQELSIVPGSDGVIHVEQAELQLKVNKLRIDGAFSGLRGATIEVFAGAEPLAGKKIGETVVGNDGTFRYRGRALMAANTRMVSLRADTNGAVRKAVKVHAH